METEDQTDNSSSNTKTLLIGVVVALGLLAALVIFSSQESADQEASEKETSAEIAKNTGAPPVNNLVTPQEEGLPPAPPSFHIFAKVWSKKCKGKRCGEPTQIAGKVSVRDRFGEIASYTVTADGSAKISNLPSGKYDLVGLDGEGKESLAKSIKIPATGTGTMTADLTIIKK